MSTTYGQIGLKFEEFTMLVQAQLKKIGVPYNAAIAKKLWNKGYTVTDAVSFFITNS